MGFRRKSDVLNLVFEGTSLEGLEVRCREVSADQFEAVAQLAQVEVSDAKATDAALAVLKVADAFAAALVEWNLEDEQTGKPVPATKAGLRKQGIIFVLVLVRAWIAGVALRAEQLSQEIEAAKNGAGSGQLDESAMFAGVQHQPL